MTTEEAIKTQEAKHQRKIEIRRKKAKDYAKDDDCLTNFKVIAELQGVLVKYGYGIPIDKAHGVAIWHLFHKLIRLLNLWNDNKEPANESLEDTHIDLENYSELAQECYTDYKK